MIVIEKESHVKTWGKYTELAGYGSTDDAFHITQPSIGGIGFKSNGRAILDSGQNINQIDYINAHGTSTPFNDKNESAAIIALFGEYSKKIKLVQQNQ